MLWLVAGLSWATPIEVTAQARVLDGTGTAINGTYPVVVNFWDVETGGTTPLYTAQFPSVSIQDGYFSVVVGTDGSLDSSVFTDRAQVWTEYVIDGIPQAPRQPFVKTAVARVAESVVLGTVAGCGTDPSVTGAIQYVAGEFLGCNGETWVRLGGGLGSTSATAAGSCRAILTANPTARDGIYWVDPNPGDTTPPIQVFCDMANGGWTLLFKLSDGAGTEDPYTQWTTGGQNEGNTELMDRGHESVDYVNRFTNAWWTDAAFGEVRVELRSRDALQKELVFDATGATSTSWFAMNRLVSVYGWTDLPTASYNFASLDGDASNLRRFFVNRSYGGCNGDYGWLVLPLAPGGGPCPWDVTGQYRVMYATASTAQNWATGAVGFADVLAIFAR